MTEEAKILENIRQNVEMGIDGINTVRKKVKDEQFLALLESSVVSVVALSFLR